MNQKDFRDKYKYDLATPVMQQFLDLKFAHFECLLLFRMGDFYELFYEDAITASRVLSIALTRRGKTAEDEIQMCGVPYHALENYLNKLLEEGFKVAICDQMETPQQAKSRGGSKAVVHRDVTRIITPGTLIEESLLAASEPNYLCAITIGKNNSAAICYTDLSTSEINICSLSTENLINELSRIRPNEILLSEKLRHSEIADFISIHMDRMISFQVDSYFAPSKCRKIIEEFYEVNSIDALGQHSDIDISSIGAVLEYINITQKENRPKFPMPKRVSYLHQMLIDSSARHNLELTNSQHTGANTLFHNLNSCVTKAGSRLLYKNLSSPLTDINRINHRLDLVEYFSINMPLTEVLRNSLKKTADLERCLSRLSMGRSTPRDLLSIKETIRVAELIYSQFHKSSDKLPEDISELISELIEHNKIFAAIDNAIMDDALNNLQDGGYIKNSYHQKVAELNDIVSGSNKHIDTLRNKYRDITGIDSLKINHNNVLGLFIDVTTRNADKIKDPIFLHRQSTLNSARFSSEELQELESKMIGAKQMLISLESELFTELVEKIMCQQASLFSLAEKIANIDLFSNLANISIERQYNRPKLTDDLTLNITDGRHPVVENFLQKNSQQFTGNDISLNIDERVCLLTGPNMAGKSTYLRQNALIIIMAQMGCFVPAGSAEIGIVDKMFCRIGAGDDLSRGQSTFMVEMLEVSAIIAQSSQRSMIILDEVGRGTSTYDGVAIAWSVLEHIHDKIRARCLFATHYHELTKLDEILPALNNFTIDIDDSGEEIIFLHKIKPGSADRSYGVHVAALAGLPKQLIRRANILLKKFEQDSSKDGIKVMREESANMSLFDISANNNLKAEKLYEEFITISPDNLTPKAALEAIYKMKEKCE